MPRKRQKIDSPAATAMHGRRITDAAARVLGCLLLGWLWSGVAAAGDRQPLSEIQDAAARYVAANAASGGGDVEAQALDPRLSLPRCDQALEAFLRSGSQLRQRTVVGVRCSGSQPWKVYVPVNLVQRREVLVLANALPRGHLLTAADLRRERRDVSRLPGGYFADRETVVGQRLKQSLRAGSIVTPPVLAARTLVRRGQTVTLNARTAAITIRMTGKALMDGALNQRIRVENTTSGRVVEGLVRSAQVVEVLVQ